MKPSHLRYLGALLLAGLTVIPACSKKNDVPAASPGETAAAQPAYKAVTDAPEAERQELEAFSKQLEKDIKEKNKQKAKESFNVGGIVDRVTAGVQASETQLSKFKAEIKDGLRQNLEFIVNLWGDQEVKYKHLVVHEGALKSRFRIVSENTGITIIDFTVQKDAAGHLGIVDFYNQAIGSGMVEQTRQAALPALAEMDRSLIERVFGKSTTTFDDLEKFGQMTLKFRNRDFKGTIAVYEGLSPALKTNLSATSIHLSALQQSGDNEGYKKALKEAAANHQSANFQFMLVDLYFLEQNYDKAIECLDSFMAAVEKDAALMALKALLQVAKGSPDTAVVTLKEALAMEPDCLYTHRKGVDVLLAAKDYPALAESMRFLETHGSYNFKGKLTEAMWADFLKSPESEPWK